MTGLLIALAVIVGYLAVSTLCVAVIAQAERLWRRVAARIWGQR
jgi:hypothetical protein